MLNWPCPLRRTTAPSSCRFSARRWLAILPAEFAARIRRVGLVNARDDENFAAAVKATGRNRFVIAGVNNDVCTVFPALSLVRDGYEVQLIADAGGSPSKIADDTALQG